MSCFLIIWESLKLEREIYTLHTFPAIKPLLMFTLSLSIINTSSNEYKLRVKLKMKGQSPVIMYISRIINNEIFLKSSYWQDFGKCKCKINTSFYTVSLILVLSILTILVVLEVKCFYLNIMFTNEGTYFKRLESCTKVSILSLITKYNTVCEFINMIFIGNPERWTASVWGSQETWKQTQKQIHNYISMWVLQLERILICMNIFHWSEDALKNSKFSGMEIKRQIYLYGKHFC